jgi:hypothetical protein
MLRVEEDRRSTSAYPAHIKRSANPSGASPRHHFFFTPPLHFFAAKEHWCSACVTLWRPPIQYLLPSSQLLLRRDSFVPIKIADITLCSWISTTEPLWVDRLTACPRAFHWFTRDLSSLCSPNDSSSEDRDLDALLNAKSTLPWQGFLSSQNTMPLRHVHSYTCVPSTRLLPSLLLHPRETEAADLCHLHSVTPLVTL